jgi:imidazolonepropionase-like amidohydrolase
MRALAVAALVTVGCQSAPMVVDDGCEGCSALTSDQLFDGTVGGPGTVVFRDGRIVKVVRGTAHIVTGTEEKLTGKTILPGLFDLHVHALHAATPYSYQGATNPVDDQWKAFLRAGVTSVLDLGASQHLVFAWRARLASGAILGPHLFAAGPFFTPTGGHPCYLGQPPADLCYQVDGPDQVAAAVAKVLPDKPDILKIILEAGAGGISIPRLDDGSIAAMAKAAGDAKLPLVAHVGAVQDVEDGLAAGVTRFAHLPLKDQLTPAQCQALAAANATVIPTLVLTDALFEVSRGALPLSDPALADDVPAETIAALGDPASVGAMQTLSYRGYASMWQQNAIANFKTCLAAGVKFVAGTDAGNPGNFHGRSLHRELQLYAQNGMSNQAALISATSAAADFVGASDLGRIAPGAVADLLVVDGNPLGDLAALDQIDRVYRGGQLIDRASLALPRGTSIVVMPTKNLAEGATCLEDDECGAAVCDPFEARCRAACSAAGSDGPCGNDAACIAAYLDDGTPVDLCYPSDGCDPVAQDCRNQAACVFLGNGATACELAGTGVAGASCAAGCARGTQCVGNFCLQLCAPGGANNGGCPMSKSCVDRSTEAGLSVGTCG